MARSGSPYSTPRDANRVPLLVAASTADGITPVVLEADPTTHALVTSGGGSSGGGTQYTDGATAITHPVGTQPVFTNGSNVVTAVSTSNPLPITGSISVGSTSDSSTFTAGSSTTGPVAGVFNDSATALTSGQQGTTRSTANRALHTNLRNNSGTEIGTSTTPLQVSLANTGTNATAVKVDGSAVTQPVSGTITATLAIGAATVGSMASITTSVVPGIAATNLGKAEDAPHTSGDTGVFALAVRNDTIATLTSTDGDYSPIAVDMQGRPLTRVTGFADLNTGNSLTSGTGLFSLIRDAAGNARGANVNASNQLSVSVDNNPALGAGSALVGKVGIDQTTPGTTNAVVDTPVTSGGLLKSHLISAATTNATNVKASPGQVYAITVFNTNAAARYLKFHNTAGTPSAGTAVTDTYLVPGSGTGSGLVINIDKGIAFSTGIAFTTVTGAADSDTTGVGLNDLIINIYYK